jgi:hypothetical protein
MKMNASNQIVLSLALLLTLTTLVAATAQETPAVPKLEPYVNKSAGFQAMMLPEPDYQAIKQGNGPKDVQHQFASGTSQGVYMVAYQDHPNLNGDDPEVVKAIFTVARDGFQKGLGGELTTEKRITLENRSGREMRFKIPSRNAEAWSRMFFQNQRWYHVFVLGTPDFVNSKDAKQFQDSFRILGRKLETNENRP